MYGKMNIELRYFLNAMFVLVPEITRFKGLGEISPDEFAGFIGPDIRLEQVTLHKNDQVQKLLEYYMGKNTMERQNFIIDNLVIEEDKPEDYDYE